MLGNKSCLKTRTGAGDVQADECDRRGRRHVSDLRLSQEGTAECLPHLPMGTSHMIPRDYKPGLDLKKGALIHTNTQPTIKKTILRHAHCNPLLIVHSSDSDSYLLNFRISESPQELFLRLEVAADFRPAIALACYWILACTLLEILLFVVNATRRRWTSLRSKVRTVASRHRLYICVI
jgi:hypothetical protein